MTDGSPFVLITALIKPHMEGHVVQALHDLPEFPGFTVIDVRGQGRGRGAGGQFRATEYNFTYQRHLQLQIICRFDLADGICEAIARTAWTGSKGDGVIYTSPADALLRIREIGREGGKSR